ncbi:MAG: hypothetical protein GX536_07875, partial [Actinobacteria bacterium]|nr:hypothetical protein [Actinomycetota bacterium]
MPLSANRRNCSSSDRAQRRPTQFLRFRRRFVAVERTLVLVKPNGVERGLIGEIIARYERRGLRISALKMLQVDTQLAQEHYAEHVGKPFFGELVAFITSGPIVAMVVEGLAAVQVVRDMNGATDPLKAAPGTIR